MNRAVPVLLVIIALAAGSIATIPTDSWIYDDIVLLKTSALVSAPLSSSRPWTRAEAERLVREADSIARSRRPGLPQRAALERLRTEFGVGLPGVDFRHGPRRPLVSLPVPTGADSRLDADLFSRAGFRHGDGNRGSGSVGAVLMNRPGDRFAFYERAEFTVFRPDSADIIDSAGEHVPGSRVHSWMELATLEIEHAYLAFRLPWQLRLEVGRDEFCWGPGRVSQVMLSDHAPALDHIQLGASYRSFRFLAFSASLSRWGEKHRFLSAQRVEVSFWDRLTLGGALMNVYSWDSLQTRSFFGMMNPLVPIYLEVANSGHGDNFLVGWDAVYYLPGARLYGQLFLDNYEFLKRESSPPNAVAWQVGGEWAPNLPVSVAAEYSRIAPFTYYHRVHHVMYEHYGVVLGHEIGPDADRFDVRLGVVPLTGFALGAGGSLVRRGYYNRGNYERKCWYGGLPLPEMFPAEVGDEKVERDWRVGFDVDWWATRDLRCLVDAGYRYSENWRGMPENRDWFEAGVGLEYRY
jgi:hypothetical protein